MMGKLNRDKFFFYTAKKIVNKQGENNTYNFIFCKSSEVKEKITDKSNILLECKNNRFIKICSNPSCTSVSFYSKIKCQACGHSLISIPTLLKIGDSILFRNNEERYEIPFTIIEILSNEKKDFRIRVKINDC